MKINEYAKHYFLYAQGWYKRSDIWEDLNKIYGEHHYTIAGMVEKEIIFSKIVKITMATLLEESKSKESTVSIFENFLFDLLPQNHWKFYAAASLNADILELKEAVIRRCLSIMRESVPDNLDPKEDCNFNILPSSREE